MRKNFFKNSVTKKKVETMRYVKIGLKVSTGITALLLISFIFIFGYDFMTQCDYFKAQNFSVTGAHRLSSSDVLKQARLDKGVNILSLNLSMARKRLLAHSWIAEAEVRRELPSNIHISLKEHNPLAVIDLGRKFIINTKGEIFKELSASDHQKLPVISGLEFSDINVKGETRSPPFDAVMNILQLGQKTESILPCSAIKNIQVDREIGLTIYAPRFESGRINSIKIGYHDYPSKYAGLENVLIYLKTRPEISRLESIDLNNLNRIVVHPVWTESTDGDQKEV